MDIEKLKAELVSLDSFGYGVMYQSLEPHVGAKLTFGPGISEKKPTTGTPVGNYQKWFDRSKRFIQSIAADRWDEFEGLYIPDSKRKILSVRTFAIRDFFLGSWHDWFPQSFGSSFDLQLAILRASGERLHDRFATIKAELAYSLQKDELAQADTLLNSGHVRAAGVIAGVVLEGHIKNLCEVRGIEIANKKVSFLLDRLKETDVITQIEWRSIQALFDIRNDCAHRGKNDPDLIQVKRLLTDARHIISTTG
jgi:hypothetical protein